MVAVNVTICPCRQDDQAVGKPYKWRLNKRYLSIIIMMFTMLCSSISEFVCNGEIWYCRTTVAISKSSKLLCVCVCVCVCVRACVLARIYVCM